MPNNHRSLSIILVICLCILGIVAANNIQEYSNDTDSQMIVTSNSNPAVANDHDPSVFGNATDVIDQTARSITGAEATTTKLVPIMPADGISASAYIAANIETGKIYIGRNTDQVLPVASMSKLVTAFAATDMLPGTTSITITKEEADVPPDGSGISAGETYVLGEMLYPLLLDSSNIAAEALASTTDRLNFLDLMRSYAWEIGMSTAYFADPSGVDPMNRASARDLFALAKYLYKFRPDILTLTRVASTSVATTTEHGYHDFVSIHPFIHDPNFIGGKTGRTPEAGDTMLTIMKISDQPVAIVVLGSKYAGREEDTKKIIEMVKKII